MEKNNMLGKEDKFVIFGPVETVPKKFNFIKDYLNLIGKNELRALVTAKLEYVLDLFDSHKNVKKEYLCKEPSIYPRYPIEGKVSFRDRESPFKIPAYNVIELNETYTKIRFKRPHMTTTVYYEPRKEFMEDLIEKEDKFIILGTLEQAMQKFSFILNCLKVIGENNLKEKIKTIYENELPRPKGQGIGIQK